MRLIAWVDPGRWERRTRTKVLMMRSTITSNVDTGLTRVDMLGRIGILSIEEEIDAR